MGLVRRPPIVTGGGRLADAVVGFTGGVMGGMASLSGPAPVIWAQLRGWNMHEQRGVNQPFNMAVLALAGRHRRHRGLPQTRVPHLRRVRPANHPDRRPPRLSLYGKVDERQFRIIVLGLLASRARP